MLETIREFGLEELAASGDEIWTRQQHADCYVSLIEAVAPTPRWPVRTELIRLIDAERDNLRAALAWLDSVGDIERYLRLATRLFALWILLGNIDEGRRWLERGLGRGNSLPIDLRALTLAHTGALIGIQGDGEQALHMLEEARALGDTVASPTLENQMDAAMLLRQIGLVLVQLGRYEEGEPYLQQSLTEFCNLRDEPNVAHTHAAIGLAAYGQSDLARAKHHCEAAVDLYRSSGVTRSPVPRSPCSDSSPATKAT